jgi:outer membrane immunogenic protein
MKRILAGAALLGTAVSAQAADLAVKAPYYKAPVALVYDWTGFYIGVNAGVGLGRDRAQHLIPGFSADSLYLSPQGGLGGGQIGYNLQTYSLLGPMVLGVEADIQGTGLRDSYPSVIPLPGIAYSQKLDWFGTVRGRVGFAHGPVLSYVTAGYAYGSVNTSITEGAVAAFSSGNRMQGGWTVGSGVEAALGSNWTGKIEYLYLNLGNKTDAFTALTVPQTLKTEIRENIFRVGLNYRIGGNSAYAPMEAANWTGFYIGGNFGSGTGRDRSTLAMPGFPVNEQFNLAPDGVNGGVQAGYNWQAANWVYGLEADIQGSSQRDNKTCVLSCAILSAAYDAKLPWFGTVRGRLGYSVGSTLFYATGGFAYGSIKTNINFSNVALASISATKGGWTAGAGIETPFTFLGLFGPNWTSKTEYLYVDLGSVSTVPFTIGATPFVASTSVKEHIFRTGLNYHFNSPVVAKY